VIVDRATAVLAEHGIESPRVDAEWIVAHVAESTGPSTVAALRQIIGLAIARSSAISLLPPRADHVGEHVSGRREPDL